MADGLLRPSKQAAVLRGKGQPRRVYKRITTNKEVESLDVTGSRYERVVADPKGLVVVVSAVDPRPAFYLRYTPFGVKQRRRLFLGYYDAKTYSLADARRDALDALADIKKRRADPALENRRARKAAETGESLADLLEPYLLAAAKGLHGGRQQPRRQSALDQDRYLFNKYLKPELGHRRYRDITSGDLKAFARKLATERELAAATVRSIMAVVRALFAFAVFEDKLPGSPAIGLKLAKAAKRERMMDDAALRKVWRALDAAGTGRDLTALPFDPSIAHLMQLLLLTGLRRAEVAGAAWSEFDLKGRLWTVPANRMKSNVQHPVPLSDSALRVLEHIKAATLDEGVALLFPMKGDNKTPVRPDRVTAEFTRMVQHLGLAQFSPHDCRRSIATTLTGRYNVPEKHIKQLLAHSRDEGVISHYNLHTYLPEQRAALDKWAAHLASLLQDDPAPKVVKLRRRS